MSEYDPRKDGIDFYSNQVVFDETVKAYMDFVAEQKNIFSTQEAGRATYKSETLNKEGMKLYLDKEQLAQIAKAGFEEMEQK